MKGKNMIFIINGNVSYNEQAGTLEIINDSSSKILLLKPTARLLSLFVRNNNLLVTREQLLNDVWEDYGLKASNNNLNNYISGLRKSLAQLGEDEILVTYPRQGFKFVAKTIHRMDAGAAQEHPDAITLHDGQEANSNGKRASLAVRAPYMIMMLYLLISILMLAAVFLYNNHNQTSMTKLGQYKNCNIYTIKVDGKHLEDIKDMIYGIRYNCNVKANVYYYGDMESKESEKKSPLLTYCPLDAVKPCENSYISN
ncbi:winged helix-turn-helix domain-containing protein [Serratia proteamaculans]|uniref:winged helix-turn-helix domain-containing protein n=1 Tax=Serratia proteamaculans TaxID=28151 RepID=UPI0021BD657A|nr:winged helix-turn-helix domain-containing protein [Serratia proteamaculans]